MVRSAASRITPDKSLLVTANLVGSDELDGEVTIAGPIVANLFVSTTGTDSDFVVKLIDVYPDDFPNPDPNPADVTMGGGYQQLARGELFRGRFRKSFDKPEAFTPGKMDKLNTHCPTFITRSGAATASWCRCNRAGSRWWTAIRKPSSIFECQGNRFCEGDSTGLPHARRGLGGDGEGSAVSASRKNNHQRFWRHCSRI